MKPLIYPISNPNGAFKYKRIRFRVKGKSRGKQHFSGLTLTSQLDRVEAWPVELRNSTGWSSRRSSWSSRWLLPSSFAYPVELLPCAKSLHAPYAPECSKRPISKDQTCIYFHKQEVILHKVNSLVSYRLQPRGSDFCATIDSTTPSSKSHGATKVVKERVDKEPRVGKDKDERGPRIEKPRLERARVEKPRSERPRADRLVQAPCVLDEESLQALFDEPLGRALKEGEDVASKARPGDKRKDPPAQAPSFKPSQLTMTLFPTKFENGKIEYKIRYKGRSRPFSRAKALVTSEQSRDPTKLKELLSQVLTITLDGLLEHMGHEELGGTWHMDAAQLDTQRKKGEAILKTSSTVYSTNRSSSSTRPAKLQLDRAEKSTVKPEKCCFPLDFPLTLNLILFI
ncbi:unnamed protein product [Microthlaspi erraticum]|uniref:Uncharacterized protein n=1 Tax=Microthlaspi erraticum TaxID=1685480 RepID=A0A6D2K418_9BRAS|nr:unnamed protein product [Microthlaspi erraticum]